jgi:hypothetical protein
MRLSLSFSYFNSFTRLSSELSTLVKAFAIAAMSRLANFTLTGKDKRPAPTGVLPFGNSDSNSL